VRCVRGLPAVPSQTTMIAGCASSAYCTAHHVYSQSGYPLVVMMEPSQYWDSHHLAPCMLRGTRRSTLWRRSVGGYLAAVVPSCAYDTYAIAHASELLLVEDEEVEKRILAAHSWAKRSQIALARGAWYGVLRISMVLVVATRAKQGPNLLSLSQMRYLGVCP
jgi:hypothetical protein